MPTLKTDLETRIAAAETRVATLETQVQTLLGIGAIRAYLEFDREEAQQREVGRREQAKIDAAHAAEEAQLQAANVVWVEGKVSPTASRYLKSDPLAAGVQYLEWTVDKYHHDRLYAPPHGGRILSRADAWSAQLARTPELAALVEAGAIMVRELDRAEAIDLERRARLEGQR